MTRRAPIPAFFLALLLAAAPGSAQETELALAGDEELVDRVVAVVGDSVVVQSEIQERLLQMQAQGMEVPDSERAMQALRRNVLENLVNEQLIVQAALRDTTIAVDEGRVDQIVNQDIDRRVSSFGGEEAMRRALAQQGMSMQAFRNVLRGDARRQQLQQQFLQKRRQRLSSIPVSEEEMRRYFQENRERLGQRPAAVTFEQVVLHPEPGDAALEAAREEAERLLERVRAHPDSFPALAREHSDDPGTREQGGDLGFFRRGQMVPAFEDAVFSLREGAISDVVRSPFGFHIIKVERIRSAERRARHILVQAPTDASNVDRARALAQSITEELRAGASVDSLQTEYGDAEQPDSLTVPKDRLGDLPPGYREALQDASAGDVVGPVEWGPEQRLNLAVLKVEDVREEGEFTFEEIRPQIRQQLQQQKMMEQLISELRERTHVEIRLGESSGS